MTKDEALKLALEALELHGKQYPHMVKGYCLDAITAIKEALAQPEQEPVQFKCTVIDDVHPNGIPLEQWAKPPQRKPLTDNELADLWYKQSIDWMEFARAIEAAHGIKENT